MAEGKIHIVAAHFVCQYVPMMTVLFERTQIVFLVIGMYHNLSSRSEHPCYLSSFCRTVITGVLILPDLVFYKSDRACGAV